MVKPSIPSLSEISAICRAPADKNKALRMGDLIIAKTRENGSCTDDDLRAAGFTDDDIRRYGPYAKSHAGNELTGGGEAA